MSKQPNTTLIGSFVVGAVALLVVATLLFGGAELFVKKNRFVTYFEGSVKGLRVGANVTFRGVPIGYVTDVRLQAELDSLNTLVPVTIEVVPGSFQIFDGGNEVGGPDLVDRLRLEDLIAAGLRAQLNVESFVTGQLQVEMDFYPNRPAVMRGVNPPHPEIPTIPNDIELALGNVERLLSRLNEKVDIDAVLENVQNLLSGASRLVNSTDLSDGIKGFSNIINSPDTQQLSTNMKSAIEQMNATLLTTRTAIENLDRDLRPLAGGVDKTLEQMQTAITNLDQRAGEALDNFEASLLVAEDTMQTIDANFGVDSGIAYQLGRTLKELESAARALRVFFDYVEQHPEALIRGKPGR